MFDKFPEFITEDTRYHDPDDPTTNSKDNPRGQLITFEKSMVKHKTMLSKEMCENSSMLDLGSCVSASGAWALEHGAMSYTGVEVSNRNCDVAVKNLQKYFSPSLWSVHNTSVLEWFSENEQMYDIVFAGGILYGHEDQIHFLEECAKRTKKYLIIESKDTEPFHSDIPMSIYKPINVMSSGKSAMVRCSNIPFIDMVLSPLGFTIEKTKFYPTSHRFAVIYVSSPTP